MAADDSKSVEVEIERLQETPAKPDDDGSDAGEKASPSSGGDVGSEGDRGGCVADGRATEEEERGREDKKKRKKHDGTNADSSGKKKFNLRDEMSEVQTVMEREGEEATKCHALHRRYQSLVREYKRMDRRLVESQKKHLEVAQHRDIIQNEYARANLARSKLENLCRELQKHSKQVAEESRQRAKEEEQRRKEVSAKFQSTINDITLKMQEHHQRNLALQQENMELAGKLKQLAEQYDAREEQFEKILHQRHLEVQLSEAKLAQHTVIAAEEKEVSLQERQQLLMESLEQQQRCEQLTRQETELRGQLSLYAEKFEEFQKTLTKSNEVFSTFKREMDKMSRTISVLERELSMWRNKYEKCNKALIDTTEERLHHEHQAHVIRVKNSKLERLCRALQQERNQLQEQLRELQAERERDGGPSSPEKPATDLSQQSHISTHTSPESPPHNITSPAIPPHTVGPEEEEEEGGGGEGEGEEEGEREDTVQMLSQ